MTMKRWCLIGVYCICTTVLSGAEKAFSAGAAQVDITPRELPVIVSGSFLERQSDTVRDRLYCRCIVLDDGDCRIAICVVDTLFMPSDLLDRAKALVAQQTGIRAENMLVSATHTHSAPSVAGVLGTGVDEAYRSFLPARIVECIQRANDQLEPARIGWTTVDASDHTHCRRWILRPDRMQRDVFGHMTVRANMHPGYRNPDFIGPAGPADTELSLVAVQSRQGRPLAVLANYSMHYFGSSPVSADYFGRFSERLAELIGATETEPALVAAMSQGTSGDLHWMDYGNAKKNITLDSYADGLARLAAGAYEGIVYRDRCSLGMLERKLTLQRRVPDRSRLAWARKLAGTIAGQKPGNRPEVYALEQMHLHEDPIRELALQVLRIGNLGITAIPCEVYGITGLKIKAQSPLAHTFNIELANGTEGYIPPPEQHALGGYTTWPARSAALETGAEARIVETLLSMLEEVSEKKRIPLQRILCDYDRAVLTSNPVAYWCLDEMQGPQARDVTGNGHHGVYENGVAFYLNGPTGEGLSTSQGTSRCAHFAGGKMNTELPGLGRSYSVEMWFRNGLPADARDFTGFLFSRTNAGKTKTGSEGLGIGGVHDSGAAQGKLIFVTPGLAGNGLVGTSELSLRSWNHVVLVRNETHIAVYLNGKETPDIESELIRDQSNHSSDFCIGGCADSQFNFEGNIAKVALYDRLLTCKEIGSHYAAGIKKD
jgi:hypothetical protein